MSDTTTPMPNFPPIDMPEELESPTLPTEPSHGPTDLPFFPEDDRRQFPRNGKDPAPARDAVQSGDDHFGG